MKRFRPLKPDTPSVYTSITRLGASWARRLGTREKHWDAGVEAVAEETLRFWQGVTSGTVSTRTLRRLGHPFGRGASAAEMRGGAKAQRGSPRGRARIPLLPINRQTGALRDTLHIRKIRPGEFSVGTRAPHAPFVLAPRGTDKMVPRGFMRGSRLPAPGPAGALDRYVAFLRRELRRHITGK